MLLADGVPDLEPDYLPIYLDIFGSVLDTDCGLMGLVKLVAGEA